MRTRLLVAGGALLIVLVAAYAVYSFTYAPAPEDGAQAARPLPSTVELADTPEKRVQGLSGRSEVADEYGMLFVFEAEGRHGFWMKDMQVPIDIIWIGADGRIVHIEHEVAPSTYPNVFTPMAPARYVLETRAGYAKEQRWDTGTRLDLASYR